MLVKATHAAMATEWRIALHAASERKAVPLFQACWEEIDRVEALLSRFRPTSEVARIVREAAFGPVTTDPEMFALLAFARVWSERTAGAFDITVPPLLRKYGFPSPDTNLAAAIGWKAMLLDQETRTVSFAEARPLELDFGAIGKGHAVDCVVRLLREQGMEAALVSAGSSTLYALGAPPAEAGWVVHVPSLGRDRRAVSNLLLRDKAVSTSACTEHFVEVAGERRGHIMDPREGSPVRGMRQTTVLATTALESEALSTAVFVLGTKAGASLLQATPGAEGLLVGEVDCHMVRWPPAIDGYTRSEAS